jgi:hypothetical protein
VTAEKKMQYKADALRTDSIDFATKTAAYATACLKSLRLQRGLFDREEVDVDAVIRWLESAKQVVGEIPDFEKVRVRLLQAWSERLSGAILELEADLKEYCMTRRWRVDGQWPEFVIEYGISIKINEKERSTNVGDVKTAANIGAISRVLEPAVASLVPKSFNCGEFLDGVLHAYEATSQKKGQLLLLDVYRSMVIQSQSSKFWRNAKATLFTPLTIDQFRARLSRALLEGSSVVKGQTLKFFPPLDTKDALFMYLPAEERFAYVGRIEFLSSGRSEK